MVTKVNAPQTAFEERVNIPQAIIIAASDETTVLTVGTNKVRFRAPFAMKVASVRTSVSTASTSGLVTVDVNKNGTTIFSTRPTIDITPEKTSVTAAAPSVLATAPTVFSSDDEIAIDIDVAGTNAAGLKVTLVLV